MIATKMHITPENFELETTIVWSFPHHGNWATHNAKWRGNWSPYVPRNILLRYSKEKDIVLDQFVGSGTTLVEAKLLGRHIIGIDINDIAIKECIKKISFECIHKSNVFIYKNDARNLEFIEDDSIDLICTHPPYANIIHYSEGQNIPEDLSNLNIKEFLIEMNKVASECYRILKRGNFCVILMGDTRKKGMVVPIGFEIMKIFENSGFKTKEIIIKEQHNCRTTGFWKKNSIKYNFLLLAHEYLFVFKK